MHDGCDDVGREEPQACESDKMTALGCAGLALASKKLVVGGMTAGDQLDQPIIAHWRVCIGRCVDQSQFVTAPLERGLELHLDNLLSRGAHALNTEQGDKLSRTQRDVDPVGSDGNGSTELLKDCSRVGSRLRPDDPNCARWSQPNGCLHVAELRGQSNRIPQ